MKIEYYHSETIDSTQTLAKRLKGTLNQNAMTVISADEQTAGKGRSDKVWISPKGENLYISFVLFVDSTPFLANAAQAACLAVTDVLQEYNIKDIGIKWPNDVLVNGKKIAGVLVETSMHDSKICVIIGIGLNINSKKDAWSTISRDITSMTLETCKKLNIQDIKRILEDKILKRLFVVIEKGFSSIEKEYNDLLIHKINDEIIINSKVVGTFQYISSKGALAVKLSNDIVKYLY